jgi:hypothetical protein
MAGGRANGYKNVEHGFWVKSGCSYELLALRRPFLDVLILDGHFAKGILKVAQKLPAHNRTLAARALFCLRSEYVTTHGRLPSSA